MSHPVKGTDTPFATAKEVITQVPDRLLTPSCRRWWEWTRSRWRVSRHLHEGTQRQGQRGDGFAPAEQRRHGTDGGGIRAHGRAANIGALAACALRLSFAGSCACGPALSAMMELISVLTPGSSPALVCFGSGTLRTAVDMSGPDALCKSTRTVVESPMRSGWFLSSLGSSRMRTGTRCTILIQLPEAFCDGRSANALPLPAAMPATWP